MTTRVKSLISIRTPLSCVQVGAMTTQIQNIFFHTLILCIVYNLSRNAIDAARAVARWSDRPTFTNITTT